LHDCGHETGERDGVGVGESQICSIRYITLKELIMMSKPIDSKDFQAANAKPLAGKLALVTGGSRGIGAAIAKELAARPRSAATAPLRKWPLP
jgi:hypothetical protein